MVKTYNWFLEKSSSNVLIIGRDIIRPGYFLANSGTKKKVVCWSESEQILSDAEKSAKLNIELIRPEFSAYNILNSIPDFSGEPFTVVYNGRDYIRIAEWVKKTLMEI